MKTACKIAFEFFQAAIHKLFLIDSDAAHDAIEHYKRSFPPDGAQSLLFKEWEDEQMFLKAKKLRNENPE